MESGSKPSVWWMALHRSIWYMVESRSSPVLVFALYAACIFGLPELAQAQNGTNAVTDPAEVRVLNSIFQEWKISAPSGQWNISGRPCSGAAIGSLPTIDDKGFNPFIKCDCSYDNNATCHITELYDIGAPNGEGFTGPPSFDFRDCQTVQEEPGMRARSYWVELQWQWRHRA
ncbi:probable LRR receptor-like serine/threonine-protein kinase At1g56130 [Alnus glutinosa]|uniref:probable LRR receptor-like serine/threonine-protein kinase At1g56130 n=1 Tax=Alnus glutinosa TaxID=3517 RepID=UPI002D787025|nr:probable LRR receptor-like serine/threonine-protein kinase At1g56130 [Alnus glutinosa]